MIALYVGRMRNMSFKRRRALRECAQRRTRFGQEGAWNKAPHIKAIAKRFAHYNDMLFLGRLSLFPIALEGALKLKEISYIHAEGYPAAEMKHGPIALISEKCPSVFFAPAGEIFRKLFHRCRRSRHARDRSSPLSMPAATCQQDSRTRFIIIPECHEPSSHRRIDSRSVAKLLHRGRTRLRRRQAPQSAKSVTVE